MTCITRFAPSPTGPLHLGGARTALFNFLFARREGGRFLLRIEDTDKARSDDQWTEEIISGLDWLGLAPDGDPFFQSRRRPRHEEIAQNLLKNGRAYRCVCTPERLADMREKQRAEGKTLRYDGRCRENNHADLPFVVRLRAPQTGQTQIHDRVQGDITFRNSQMDDFVLLRANGAPTYMLSVVADDHDMSVSHIIRGADHLTNAARQSLLYQALEWKTPIYAHIPLIHGADGAKLSKRHGAESLSFYRRQGYLPAAMLNYLARLGWAHGDDEIFSFKQASAWFSLEGVGKSPARFDPAKLDNLNAHYLRAMSVKSLSEAALPFLAEALGEPVSPLVRERFLRALPPLRLRAKTLQEIGEAAVFLGESPPAPDEKARKHLNPQSRALLKAVLKVLERADWNAEALESAVKILAESKNLKLGAIAQPMRAALTGRAVSPGLFDLLLILGRDESLARLHRQAL